MPADLAGQQRNSPAAPIDWLIESGSAVLVAGGTAPHRSMLLRLLAGFESPASGRIEYILANGGKFRAAESGNLRTGFLPPPGEETFVGATVEQELSFCLPEGIIASERLARLEAGFGVEFRSRAGRSVWSLSDGERRLLSLVSQALAEPGVWFCDEPLAMLDGRHTKAVLSFLAGESRRGVTVVAAAAGAGRLIGWAGSVFILSSNGGVLFSGDSDSITEGLSGEAGCCHPLIRKLAAAGIDSGAADRRTEGGPATPGG
ncbi:MAG: ATP-binding cassette domain-containing protein [Candidatus Glassbacteria bacterium]|nr:ATP-binding cassette domain-containing protein [Candidatus Glassbacteria bacterium]